MIIRGFTNIIMQGNLDRVSADYKKIFGKRANKGDPVDMERNYKICINCIHLPYEHLWKALEKHSSGTCYLKCKKGVPTHDLSTQAEKCYYFKLQPIKKVKGLECLFR